MNNSAKTIFEYTDYRVFLKDRFDAMKSKNPHFSYRVFNRQAGVQSSSYLKNVIDAKRNLGLDGIHKVAKGLNFVEKEKHFFELLVQFNQSKTHQERDYYFKLISQNTQFRKVKPITASQYNLFTHWYYVTVLELLRLDTKFKKDIHWLEARILPKVLYRDLKKAIQDLKDLNLLQENPDGSLARINEYIATSDEVAHLMLRKYHAALCELAKKAVQEQPHTDREFSALTVAMSEPSFLKVKQELQEVRKKLHRIIEEDVSAPKKVVGQINLQFFKLNRQE